MSDRIDLNAFTPIRTGFSTPAAPDDAETGDWQGERVQLAPAQTSLLDRARKQLDALGGREAEIESRPPQMRRFSSRHAAHHHHVHAEMRARALLGRMPDFDPNRITPLIEDIEDTEDTRTILQKSRKHFGDPSHAYLALELVRQRLRDEGRHDLADRAAEARDLLEEEDGAATRAGINISLAAFETSAGDRDAAAALRTLYRDAVFAQPGPLGLYRGMIGKGGVEEFTQQLRYLTRAVGDDLSAEGPSVDPARLHQLVRDLSSLRVLETVHERCALLTKRLHRATGQEISPTTVIGHLLPLVEAASADASRFTALPEKLGLPERPLAGPILFLNEARDVVAMLPTALFRDLEARFAVFQGMRQALDTLIDREENE